MDAPTLAPKTAPGAGTGIAIAAGWLFGGLALAALITAILHFGDIRIFVAAMRGASPFFLAAAIVCQFGTYACGAMVWSCVVRRARVPVSLFSLLKLSLMELFANQAVPVGGLSGSLIVMRGLMHRGVPSPVAITALMVGALSYYAAYLLLGLAAFWQLWQRGDFSVTWQILFISFAVVVVILAAAVLVLSWSRADLIPTALLRWRPFAQLARLLDQARIDMLHDPALVSQAAAFQAGIFLLDAATLWCTCRAVGLHLDFAATFTSFVLASVVTTLSPIPMGLGSFEASCTGLLHLMGGGLETSLAATLLLRGFTLWLPMLPGLWVIRREAMFTAPPQSARTGSVSP